MVDLSGPDATGTDHAFRVAGFGIFAASAGDLVTTEWGLSNTSLQEGNPIATNRAVRVTHHILGPAAVWWTTQHLHRKGKRNLALSLRIALTVAYSYAMTHNVRTVNGIGTP